MRTSSAEPGSTPDFACSPPILISIKMRQGLAQLGGRRVEPLRQAQRIHRINRLKQFSGLGGLVRLQMPDEMKARALDAEHLADGG